MCISLILVPERGLVPCGKCPDCISKRISGWSFRILREALSSYSAYFVTMTYDTDHVNITKKGYLTLTRGRKSDLTKFFKKLRKRQETYASIPEHYRIKYFAVGEYGSNKSRPHYHALILNLQLDVHVSKQDLMWLNHTNFDGKYHVKLHAWDKGTSTFGKVEGASIGYCFKYISKPGKIPMHRNDDRLKEYCVMSKGLGKNYLTPAMISWHKADLENRMYINLPDGKKAGMPRYYKDKIYSEAERTVITDAYKRKLEIENPDQCTDRFEYANIQAVERAKQRMYIRNKDPTKM